MFPKDKVYHFAAGAIISIAASMLLPIYSAFILSCVVGLLKEVYDYQDPKLHTCDIWGFIATSLGGLVSCLILIGFI